MIDDLHEGKVSEARLWREIIDNLSKDLLARDRINVQHVRKSSSRFEGVGGGLFLRATHQQHPPPPPGLSRGGIRDGASAHGSSGDTVIFTCGHDFAHRDFVDSVLPELRKRLQVRPEARAQVSGLWPPTNARLLDHPNRNCQRRCPSATRSLWASI